LYNAHINPLSLDAHGIEPTVEAETAAKKRGAHMGRPAFETSNDGHGFEDG
jgi:hypothetical protein